MTKPTGKPRGRPPKEILQNAREFKIYAQQYGAAALLDAATEILDRAYGKPKCCNVATFATPPTTRPWAM